jgi:hypothetical protein
MFWFQGKEFTRTDILFWLFIYHGIFCNGTREENLAGYEYRGWIERLLGWLNRDVVFDFVAFCRSLRETERYTGTE